MREIDRVNLGFLNFIFSTIAAAMTADQIIKTIEGPPKVSSVTIPGVLSEKEVSANIVEQINKSRQELEALHQKDLELARQQEELTKKIAQREALKQKITKIAPFVVIGGVVLGALLIGRGLMRRKK